LNTPDEGIDATIKVLFHRRFSHIIEKSGYIIKLTKMQKVAMQFEGVYAYFIRA
jgi:hypothetical protein